MWRYGIGIFGLITILAGWRIKRLQVQSRRLQYEQAAQLWRETSVADRYDAVHSLVKSTARNAPAWYLLGCSHLRSGHMNEAARAFGMAYHADSDLESAALLTFASLKATSGDSSDIAEQIIRTWREMNRTVMGRHSRENLLFSCLESTTRDAPDLSPVGRLIWRVVGPQQQLKMEKWLESKQGFMAEALRAAD